VAQPTTFDSPRNGVTERAVIQFEKDGEFFIVIRTSDTIRMIISSSLNHALYYEKKRLAWLVPAKASRRRINTAEGGCATRSFLNSKYNFGSRWESRRDP
jgi:hypothetical protein